MNNPLKMLRYNTGTDKKAFVQFKNNYDVVIFNATIVAHSGASVADLVSMHSHKYIIDPQTHIFQQETAAISSDPKSPEKPIKQSILKYLHELPDSLSSIVKNEKRPLTVSDFDGQIPSLVESVYSFESEYVSRFIEKKEYDKYLKFAHVEPSPKLIVAPYFMLKASQSLAEQDDWLKLNNDALKISIQIKESNNLSVPVAAQLVLEKQVLLEKSFLSRIEQCYNVNGYDHIFLWIDDFNAFTSQKEINVAFSRLVELLNRIGKMPLMAYGGYESIILCAHDSPYRMYGVAQSVGYGEYRPITPVGGGMPVNKYYFPPLHQRMRFDEAAFILSQQGYFDEQNPVNNELHARQYYAEICSCKTCKDIIQNDINNFLQYNGSKPYIMKTKNGLIERNRPTTDSLLIAALHFLSCKANEWKETSNISFCELQQSLLDAYRQYKPEELESIETWCNIYGKKKN